MLILLLMQACSKPNTSDTIHHLDEQIPTTKDVFFDMTMNAAPFLPEDKAHRQIACDLPVSHDNRHKTAKQIDYASKGWEQRIPAEFAFASETKALGKVLLIDTIYTEDGPAYFYLSNGTQNERYEPWSSSKIFAYTGALASMRHQGLGVPALIGQTNLADMITSINSYEAFGTASSDSNKLATFFANLAGRDYLTSLFFDQWMHLSDSGIFFKGAYGPEAFVPENNYWHDLTSGQSKTIEYYKQARNDPGYLDYRCTSCGLTGNKPMTTLAQAEWLKRLAMHEKAPQTAHPYLQFSDIQSLFYGTGNSLGDEYMAGMSIGISTMLQQALAANINPSIDAKSTLDEISSGKWRVFQKIGWGASETRNTTENVVLAHVCLPNTQSPYEGIQFTIAAQVSVPEANEQLLSAAGQQMQALLTQALADYFVFKQASND